MSGGRMPKSKCSGCGRMRAVTKDGRMFSHQKFPTERDTHGWPKPCRGEPTAIEPPTADALSVLIEIRELLRTIHDVVTRQP